MTAFETAVFAIVAAAATSLVLVPSLLLYYRRANSRPPRAYLYHSNGRRILKHALDGDVMRIGRHRDNEIRLQDSSVSRFHAQIVDNHNGSFVVRDLGSKNGVKIFYRPVKSSVLSDGDVLFIGNVGMKFVQYPADFNTFPNTVELEPNGPVRMTKRRRRAERFAVTKPVRIYTDTEGWVSGIATSISEEGMFVEVKEQLPVRTPLDIIMQRNVRGGWIKLTGEAVRSEGNGIAVMFTDVDRHLKSVLHELGKSEMTVSLSTHQN